MDAAATPAPLWRRLLASRLVKIAFSVLFLALLLTYTDTSDLVAAVKTAQPGWVLAALVMYVVSQVVSAWRWMILARAVGFDQPFSTYLRSYFAGLYMNLFAPSTVAGDIGRALYIAGTTRSRALALTTVIADRALGFVVLVFIGAVAVLTQPYRLPRVLYLGSWIVPPATLLLWLFGPQLMVRIFSPESRWRVLVERDLYPYWRDRALLVNTSLIAAVMHVLQIIAQIILAWALGLAVPAMFFFIFVPVVNILGMLPISFNGIGVREAGYIFFMKRIGVESHEALAVGLLSSAIVLITGIAGALVFALSRSQLRRATTADGEPTLIADDPNP
jgi:uncharacterized membrane protein YbhN (UPF0104 family)